MANFTCGFGKRDITPPMGHGMAGYFAPRHVKGVITPLFARAMVLDNGSKKAVFIALDIVRLDNKVGDPIRQRVAEALGMDSDAVLICVSHTHTGPDVHKEALEGEYGAYFREQIFEAVMEASKDMVPARLFYGKTEAKNISFIRRYVLKDGTVKTNPGKFKDMLDHTLGDANEELRLLKVVRDGADDIYLFNFNTHADTIGGEYICSDWPGFACDILEAAIPGSKAMFVLGPQGDVNHHNYFAPNLGHAQPVWDPEAEKNNTTHARHMARVIAGQILTICDKAVEVEGNEISYGSKEVVFDVNKPTGTTPEMLAEAQKVLDTYNEWYANPGDRPRPTTVKSVQTARRLINMQDAPDNESFYVFGLKLGDLVFGTMPGEPFTELGREVYKEMGLEKMFVISHVNGSCGYIPVKSAYEDGGYESNGNRYQKTTPERLVGGLLDVLKGL